MSQACSVCGEIAWESQRGYTFCGDCWDWYTQIQMGVDWGAEPSFVVSRMRRKLIRDMVAELRASRMGCQRLRRLAEEKRHIIQEQCSRARYRLTDDGEISEVLIRRAEKYVKQPIDREGITG